MQHYLDKHGPILLGEDDTALEAYGGWAGNGDAGLNWTVIYRPIGVVPCVRACAVAPQGLQGVTVWLLRWIGSIYAWKLR